MYPLTFSRYLSVKDINVTRSFPCKIVIACIAIGSFAVNLPRFFELRAVEENETNLVRVNNTGNVAVDYEIHTSVRYAVKPTAEFYTIGYFLGYNMIGSFVISLFVPVATLSVLNTLIFKRLREIWRNQSRLGVREKRNTRAALSLVLVVIFFFICHSIKLVVSGYQVRKYVIESNLFH